MLKKIYISVVMIGITGFYVFVMQANSDDLDFGIRNKISFSLKPIELAEFGIENRQFYPIDMIKEEYHNALENKLIKTI